VAVSFELFFSLRRSEGKTSQRYSGMDKFYILTLTSYVYASRGFSPKWTCN